MTKSAKPAKSLGEKYNDLPSSTRFAIIGGVVVALFLVLPSIFGESGDIQINTGDQNKSNLVMAKPNEKQTVETVSAELAATKATMRSRDDKIAFLEAQITQLNQKDRQSGARLEDISSLGMQIQSLQERVNNLTLNQPLPGTQPSGAGPATSAGKTPLQAAFSPDSPSAGSAAPMIQVIGGPSATPAKPEADQPKRTAYFPAGTNFEVILLNGMDASTSLDANKEPTPALARVKTEAILPNFFNFDVRECFVMLGGWGNLSSERVEMRTDIMSCLDENGGVWEGKINGYAVGEDGKTAVRGRLVTKQGALLAKSFLGGFVAGLANAFQGSTVPSLNLSSGGTMSYQMPSTQQVLGQGLTGGLQESSSRLAQFYLRMAEQMFPILEVDAGRKVTLILGGGVEFKKGN